MNAITPSRKKAILLSGTLLVVAAIGFDMYRKSGDVTPPTAEQQEQAAAVLAKVGKLIELPTEPAPALAMIADVEWLRKQNPFYNRAMNGDFLIVTQTRAIIYDPEENKIIDVVPVQLQQASSSSQPAPTAPPPEKK